MCTLGCKTVSSFQPNIPFGGRIVALAAHPDNEQTIIAAAETGGLFRTINGGINWVHINSLVPFRMFDVAYSPTNPNVIIATTLPGLRTGRGDSGIWRSTNGGKSWSHPDPAVIVQGSGTTFRPISGYGISFAPNSSTVIVGVDRGMAISRDNGATWKLVKPTGTFADNIYAVLFLDANKCVVTSGSGVYYSADSGQSWKASPSLMSTSSAMQSRLAVSPLNSDHVFLATDIVNTITNPVASATMTYRQTFFSSDAGQTWKEIDVPVIGDQIRHSMVRTSRTGSNAANEFILYYGNGVDLFKKRIRQTGTDLDFNSNWEPIQVGHTDPTDIIFDLSQTKPLLLSGDGGVQKHNASNDTWYMAGSGNQGLHALQIMDVAGIYDTKTRMAMWQFGTWDNSVWNSTDDGSSWPKNHSGEGYHMQFEGRSGYDHPNFHSVHVSCWACSNVKSKGALQDVVYWEAVKDSMKGDPPWYLTWEGHYVQSTARNYWIAGIPVLKYELHLTPDRGDTWKLKNIIHFTPHQRLHVVEEFSGPMIYIPVYRSGKLGLLRVKRFTPNGVPIVYNADGEGYGSLGESKLIEARYPVMAVNPRDPLHVIMADVETHQMKYTYDGGKCWWVDESLTRAVTDNGNLLFEADDLIQPTAIAFDPDHPRVVVGTRQAGLFESIDDGVSWSYIPDSRQMTNVSSLFYGFHDDLVVTTFGRGMWKIKLNNNNLKKRRHPYTPCHDAFFENVRDGVQTVFEDPYDLPGGLDGHVIINPDGEITDIGVNADGVIDQVAVDRGSLVMYDSLLRPRPVRQIDQRVSTQTGNFDRLPRAQQLIREGKHIRGFVARDRRLLGFITADQPWEGFEKRLADTVVTEPYIYLLDTTYVPASRLRPGDEIVLSGINFYAEKPLSVFHEDEIITADVRTNKEGGFIFRWTIPSLVKGGYSIAVEQEKEGKRLRLEVPYTISGNH